MRSKLEAIAKSILLGCVVILVFCGTILTLNLMYLLVAGK